MQPDLHPALATYPGGLPLLPNVHEGIPYGLAALERDPDVLTPDERDLLLASYQRLAPFAADPGETAVLHGSAAARRSDLWRTPPVRRRGRA